MPDTTTMTIRIDSHLKNRLKDFCEERQTTIKDEVGFWISTKLSENQIDGVFEVDTPLYKVKERGSPGVTDEELLSLFLEHTPQRNALERARGALRHVDLKDIAFVDKWELASRMRISDDEAAKIDALMELGRRAHQQGMGYEPHITSPTDTLTHLSDIKDEKREHFVVIFLNARNQVIKKHVVSIGTINASLVHPREVFEPAVGSSACSVILAHNHPSDDVTPSREDIELTRRMVQAGEIMGIEVLDHLIVGSTRFCSMKEANVF